MRAPCEKEKPENDKVEKSFAGWSVLSLIIIGPVRTLLFLSLFAFLIIYSNGLAATDKWRLKEKFAYK